MPLPFAAGLRSLLFSPASAYLAASTLARAASIVLIPIYTRKLSPADYGDYALSQLLIAILSLTLCLGLTAAVARFYFAAPDREVGRRRAGGAAEWLVLVCVACGALVQLAINVLADPRSYGIEGRYALTLVTWASVGLAISNVPSLYLRMAQRPLGSAAFQLVPLAAVLGSGVLFVAVLDRGLDGAFEASAAGYAISAVAALAFIWRELRAPLSFQLLREAFSFSWPFIPHFLSNQLQQTIDRWVLKVAGLQVGLGEYALASQVTSPASMAIGAWTDAQSPEQGEAYREGGSTALRARLPRFERSTLLVGVGASVVVLAVLPAVAVIVGPAFRDTLWLVPALLLTVVADVLYYPNVNALFYEGRKGRIAAITVSCGILNLALTWVLVGSYGVFGAIAGRFVALACRAGLARAAARTAPAGPVAPSRPTSPVEAREEVSELFPSAP